MTTNNDKDTKTGLHFSPRPRNVSSGSALLMDIFHLSFEGYHRHHGMGVRYTCAKNPLKIASKINCNHFQNWFFFSLLHENFPFPPTATRKMLSPAVCALCTHRHTHLPCAEQFVQLSWCYIIQYDSPHTHTRLFVYKLCLSVCAHMDILK